MMILPVAIVRHRGISPQFVGEVQLKSKLFVLRLFFKPEDFHGTSSRWGWKMVFRLNWHFGRICFEKMKGLEGNHLETTKNHTCKKKHNGLDTS